MLTLHRNDADHSIVVRAPQEITIVLDEHPTTGYRWAIDAVEGTVTLVSSTFVPGPGTRPGAGGQRQIVVHAAGTGPGRLLVRCARAWEPETAEADRVTFAFTVD